MNYGSWAIVRHLRKLSSYFPAPRFLLIGISGALIMGTFFFGNKISKGSLSMRRRSASAQNGFHRDKQFPPRFLYKSEDGFGQCLFGEHQLQSGFVQYDGTQYDAKSKIFLVESEKTAVIMSHVQPQFIWLATGGASGLTKAKARVLKGRYVFILYDCDDGGRTGANNAFAILKDVGAKAQIFNQFSLFPNAPAGYDFADCIFEYLIGVEAQ